MLIVSCVEFIPLQLPTTVSLKCVLISINFGAEGQDGLWGTVCDDFTLTHTLLLCVPVGECEREREVCE